MSYLSKICDELEDECKSLMNIVYVDHNKDPVLTALFSKNSAKNNKENESNVACMLSKDKINNLTSIAVGNEILKTSRGNGQGAQVIYSGTDAFAEAPLVSNKFNTIELTQQQNVDNGFAPNNAATWIKRVSSDHIRRNKPESIDKSIINDTFDMPSNTEYETILAEPMKINLKPDWDASNKNFLSGQEIDCIYDEIGLWVTKGYFAGSMVSALCDPRQITMIIKSGSGVIQSPFGLLSYEIGDLIQIPPNTPFSFYVALNETVEMIGYYSKESMIFPNSQLNVSDINQVPFSPASVIQSKYSCNESITVANSDDSSSSSDNGIGIEYRGEFMRVEQCNKDGLWYKLFYFPQSKTAFNWLRWVHMGPVVHKVNLICNFERIGTNIGHKDPNIWLILQHSISKSFGIAFLTGMSFIEVNYNNYTNSNGITYTPAYFHLNGVHEKGELCIFGNNDGDYDARKGIKDGICLVHPAGVGHGGDESVVKTFIIKAIIKYILNANQCDSMVKQIMGNKEDLLCNKFGQMNKNDRNERINQLVKSMYSYDCGTVITWETDEKTQTNVNDVTFSMDNVVKYNLIKAINMIVNGDLKDNNQNGKFQTLGMNFGFGYLLVESRNPPMIPKCEKNSSFRKVYGDSYGISVDSIIVKANQYLKQLNTNKFSKM